MEIITISYKNLDSKLWWSNLWNKNNFKNWTDAEYWLLNNFDATVIANSGASSQFDIVFPDKESFVRFSLIWAMS